MTQFITLNETKKYLARISADPPDEYFQHILLGWMKFVAPLTPPSVDGIPNIKLNIESVEPLDNIPGSVAALIVEAARISGPRQLSETKSFSLWSKAWSTMWIWVQRLYHDHLRMLNQSMDAFVVTLLRGRCIVLRAALSVFVNYDGKPMVAEILASHPRILNMMAVMWIEEGTKKNPVHGFKSWAFADPRLTIHQGFQAEVISACGSAGELVNLACQRIERNLGQAKQDYSAVYQEVASLKFLISQQFGGPSIITTALYASSRLATLLMQVWARVTSNSIDAGISAAQRDLLLGVCLAGTLSLVEHSPHAYDRVLEILHHDLLSLLMKSVHLVLPSSTNYEAFSTLSIVLLQEILCPATVHRKILYSMNRRIVALRNVLSQTLNPKVYLAWSRLMTLLDERKNGYDRYIKGSQPVLLCSSLKVSVFIELHWLAMKSDSSEIW